MPSTTINASSNIAVLDSKIVADLCIGKFYIDISDSTYIGSGADSVLGANVQITNPLGVIVKPFGSNYEIAPGLSAGMDAVIAYNVPTVAGNYMYGSYTVTVELYDEDGTRYTVTKTFSICEPDSKNKTLNYGKLSARINGNCKDGKVIILVDNVPAYKGKLVESQVNAFTLLYPTESGLDPIETTVGTFSVQLYEGQYKLSGTICALYALGDNVFVKIKYKVKREKIIKCILDECCIQQRFVALNESRLSDCSPDEKENTANIIVDALMLIKCIQLTADCGEDPSDMVTQLEQLLGCSCTCNCNEGIALIDGTPTRDITIEGCNVVKTSLGLTDSYLINVYGYLYTVVENGGILTVTPPLTDGCTKSQEFTFSVTKMYAAIKAQIDNMTEYQWWGEVISNVWDGLDVTCLGVTSQQWATMTYKERTQAIINAICGGGKCVATLTDAVAEIDGSGIVFSWSAESSGVAAVDLFLNGLLVATVLPGVFSYEYTLASEQQYEYKIIAKCSNGNIGSSYAGTINYLRRIFVAPPSIYSPYIVQTCPNDLTINVHDLPKGISAEWHSANNTKASTLVADPTNALQGTYFVFAKDSDNVYSEGVQVQLVCETTGSCSAPQNLQIVPVTGGNQVQFQSAAYPPPANSYTVKRKLASAADLAGNYTTLGSPVWAAPLNRWVITDNSALTNTKYTYRAISNCGSTSPYLDAEYASLVCPTLIFTPYATDMAYRFTGVGGQVDKYKVIIYSDAGSTVVHTNTHVPSFSTPITGRFFYLDPGTHYWIGVQVHIGDYVKVCPLQQIETYPNTATLTIDYVAGIWSAVLSSPLSEILTVSAAVAIGSNNNCVTAFETDTMPSMSIPAGQLDVENETLHLSYLSQKYHIDDNVNIGGGIGGKKNGETFVIDGVTVTVAINHLVCGFYPA